MLDTKEEQYEALVQTREFLSDPDNWIKGRGTSADGQRHCVMAYISINFLERNNIEKLKQKRAGWRAAPEFYSYLNRSIHATRPGFNTVTAFNDSRYVSHEEVLAWLDERIEELAPKEEPKEEVLLVG